MNRTPVLVKACLNGDTSRHDHPAVPLSPEELAHDARQVVAAGAGALHAHPRRGDGAQTLDPDTCAATVLALRAACPGVPVGLTTIASAQPDPAERLALVRAWPVWPDFASVNFSEHGAVELCALLIEQGVGIEAGLWSVDDVEIFLASGLAGHCLRVLVEPQEEEPAQAMATARAIAEMLAGAGIALPQVHHGYGLATWAVIEQALARGHDIRVGLEDTTQRPRRQRRQRQWRACGHRRGDGAAPRSGTGLLGS